MEAPASPDGFCDDAAADANGADDNAGPRADREADCEHQHVRQQADCGAVDDEPGLLATDQYALLKSSVGNRPSPRRHDLHADAAGFDDGLGHANQVERDEVEGAGERDQHVDDGQHRGRNVGKAAQLLVHIEVAHQSGRCGQQHDDRRFNQHRQRIDQCAQGREVRLPARHAGHRDGEHRHLDSHQEPAAGKWPPQRQHAAGIDGRFRQVGKRCNRGPPKCTRPNWLWAGRAGSVLRSQCPRSRHGSASSAEHDTFGRNAPVITLQKREAGSPTSCSGASRLGRQTPGTSGFATIPPIPQLLVLTPSALLSNVADVDAESDAEPCGCDARGAADWP